MHADQVAAEITRRPSCLFYPRSEPKHTQNLADICQTILT